MDVGSAAPQSEVWKTTEARALFDLSTLVYSSAKPKRETLIEVYSGERRDSLVAGAIGDVQAVLSISAITGRPATSRPLFVDLAEQASTLDASIRRFGNGQMLSAPFDNVEWAPLSLAGVVERSCLGFRTIRGARASISGVFCPDKKSSADAPELMCLLERLTVTRAGSDVGLAEVLRADVGGQAACRSSPR